MTQLKLTRRAVMRATLALAATAATPTFARDRPMMHVVKDPECGCCTGWARIMQAKGFDVTVEHRSGAALTGYKTEAGIPVNMFSCHTAKVEGYTIEGHVPSADIRRLLAERPKAVGLAVPDMPYGSPGMGPENERDPYTVFLIRMDGTTEVFAEYAAG